MKFVDGLWRDLLYSARMLLKRPGFTAIAVVTLALGIGANTAIFSLVRVVLLRPLPFSEPERLIGIRESKVGEGTIILWPGARMPRYAIRPRR